MLIINGKILTMEDKTIESGFVRIKGELIDEVGDMRSCKVGDEQEEILDVKGAWVMPGLIEAHAHIGITEEKWGTIADDCNETTMPATATLRAIDAINPMDPAFHDAIQAGITAVMAGPGSANVVGGQFVVMKTQGRCVDNMIIKNPAAMKVAFGENPKTTYGDKDQYPATRMGIAASGFPVISGTTLTSRSKLEVQNRNYNTCKRLYEQGILFAVTTDHPVALIEHLPICAGLAVKHGLPMEEGLKSITINAARILRVEDKIGSIRCGKHADVAIFSGNPMDLFSKTLYTIINGKVVYGDLKK